MSYNELYAKIGNRFCAWRGARDAGNIEAMDKHEDRLTELINMLPHGSGIDGETKLNYDKSRAKQIVIDSGYHFMDENGFYDGWYMFSIIITPCWGGFDIKLTGASYWPKKYRHIKEYLIDEFSEGLRIQVD